MRQVIHQWPSPAIANACPPPTAPKPTSSPTACSRCSGALDWAAAGAVAAPWVAGGAPAPAAVLGDGKPAEGIPDLQRRGPGADAAGRGAAARARCRNRDRAHRRPARAAPTSTASRRHARWRACRTAPSRCPRNSCPATAQRSPACWQRSARAPWWPRRCAPCSCWAASSCWARTSRRRWTRPQRRAHASSRNLRFSYDMLGEGARTEADALRYLAQLPPRDRSRSPAAPTRRAGPSRTTASPSSSARCIPRYEDAQRERVLRELVPRVWQLCELAARANINLTIDAEESRPAGALARRVRGAGRAGGRRSIRSGRASAWRCRPTRRARWNWSSTSARIGAQARPALHVPAGQGRLLGRARSSARRSWACRTTRCSRTSTTPTSPTWPAPARCWQAPDVIYPAVRHAQRRHHRRHPADGARSTGAAFELQRLHGMGEGIYREVLKDAAARLPRLRAGRPAPRPAGLPGAPPAGERRQLLLRAPARRRVGGHGRAAGLAAAAGSRAPSLPLPPDLYGPARATAWAWT